jgi:hypothetical protein
MVLYISWSKHQLIGKSDSTAYPGDYPTQVVTEASSLPEWKTESLVRNLCIDYCFCISQSLTFHIDFNLDFYTEVQDLSHLGNLLNSASPRYSALNMAICSLIEDYSLVGFEALAVEVRHCFFIWRASLTRKSG